jgi:hypothetical protein
LLPVRGAVVTGANPAGPPVAREFLAYLADEADLVGIAVLVGARPDLSEIVAMCQIVQAAAPVALAPLARWLDLSIDAVRHWLAETVADLQSAPDEWAIQRLSAISWAWAKDSA